MKEFTVLMKRVSSNFELYLYILLICVLFFFWGGDQILRNVVMCVMCTISNFWVNFSDLELSNNIKTETET